MKKPRRWAINFWKRDTELMEEISESTFENGDLPALIIAALVTIMPVVLLVIATFFLTIAFFFRLL
jgi:hypothetical protein